MVHPNATSLRIENVTRPVCADQALADHFTFRCRVTRRSAFLSAEYAPHRRHSPNSSTTASHLSETSGASACNIQFP
jgi:hypothetical protein